MNLRTQLSRPALGFDLLRVYLGIGLTVRGGLIASDPAVLDRFIGNADWLYPMLTAHAVVLSHVVGGLLLVLGLCTRWAAAVQIPTVAAALFLVHWQEGLFARTQSTEFAALVLVALILYALFGAGDLSVDHFIERARARAASREGTPLVPDVSEPHAPALRARSDFEDGPRESIRDLGPALAADSPRARALYHDVKLELVLLVTMLCVLFVLLAGELYVAATAWVIVSVFIFGIWRIGRAQFQ